MRVVRTAEAGALRQPGATLCVLLTDRDGGPARILLGVVEIEPGARAPAGDGVRAHPCEGLAYVVAGNLRLWVEGEEALLGPGDAVYIEPGERHCAVNPGDGPARAVFVLSPPIPLGP